MPTFTSRTLREEYVSWFFVTRELVVVGGFCGTGSWDLTSRG
jgi:hypothetical protein